MRHIENGSLFTSMMMRSQHTHIRVLNRHGITSKRDHLTTMLDMEIVQGSLLDRLGWMLKQGQISIFFQHFNRTLLPHYWQRQRKNALP